MISVVVESESVHVCKKESVQLYIAMPTPHAFKSFWRDPDNDHNIEQLIKTLRLKKKNQGECFFSELQDNT